MIKIQSQQISDLKSLKTINPQLKTFQKIKHPHLCDGDSLVFISNKTQLELALKNNAGGLIVLSALASELTKEILAKTPTWSTEHIQKSMQEVLPLFDLRKLPPRSIHPTAVIHPTAKIGQSVSVGPYVIVEADCTIEDGVHIESHCFIGENCVIKKNTHLQSHCSINAFSIIGERCHLSPHVVIGSDGFGYTTDFKNGHKKVPQIGNVVLEDDVDFGAHSAVDRATFFETRIKKGNKFDNFTHIAHNCEIGENGVFAGGFMTAGSAVIGRNMMASGGVHINGHINITDNVVLTARAGALESIDKPGFYGGFPAIPHKENLKVLAILTKLPKIRKQISLILKHLGIDYKD